MKFGLNYHQMILPRWADYYVDYNGLKMQHRVKSLSGASADGILDEFIREIDRFETLYNSKYASMLLLVNGLASEANVDSPATASPDEIDPLSEIDLRALKEYLADFRRLQWFGRVNTAAIERLISNFNGSWVTSFEALDRLKAAWGNCHADRTGLSASVEETFDHLITSVQKYQARQARQLARENGGSGERRTSRGRQSTRGNSDLELPRAYLELTSVEHDVDLKLAFLQSSYSVNREGLTVLDVAILLGKTPLLETLLLALMAGEMQNDTGYDVPKLLGRLLILAVRCNDTGKVGAVLKHNPDMSVRTSLGESALHCAARSENLALLQQVARHMISCGESLDTVVPRTGWTPVMAACAIGDLQAVTYLLDIGADATILDVLSRSAKAHAAYRGHLTIASLGAFDQVDSMDGEVRLVQRPFNVLNSKSLFIGTKAVIVTLGSVQGGHDRKTLQLPQLDSALKKGQGAACGMFLEISVPGSKTEPKIVPLPIVEDLVMKPLDGRVERTSPSTVTVKLWAHAQGRRLGNDKRLLSSGTAVLGQDDARFGASRDSMVREVTVVMLDKESMEYSGTVLLSYVVATPFYGLEIRTLEEYRREPGDSAHLVGHRGLGQNTAGRSNLQIGENTITSFLSAHKLGAPFVEFDVQLTRDLEPVIYHDFSFNGSGADIPIHDITLAEYKRAGEIHPGERLGPGAGTKRPRALSGGDDSAVGAFRVHSRRNHAPEVGGRGANTRGHSIQDAFATLEELLVDLPDEIGFNIEMKYQRLHEAVAAGVAPVTIDINTFVDAALSKLKRFAGNRRIILSSFTPEICILLRLKQSRYPVLFITNAGKPPMVDRDLRAASLQMAMKFAKYWGLQGIVLACDTFLLCPGLISLVRRIGLVCASYGLGNNEPANARKQVDAGLDIIIVDKVRLISEELSKAVPKAEEIGSPVLKAEASSPVLKDEESSPPPLPSPEEATTSLAGADEATNNELRPRATRRSRRLK